MVTKSTKCKRLLVTFGDGGDDFRAAAIRLAEQGASTGLFDTCLSVSESGLESSSQSFRDFRPSLEQLDVWPLYYRAVKPWLLEAALRGQFGDFHCVMYADAGCEFSTSAVARHLLKKRLDLACRFGAFAEKTNLQELHWTKLRTLTELEVTSVEATDCQFQATWFVMRNDVSAKEFARRWIALSSPERGLWQDPSSPEEAGHNLVEHRRDQSIFSILFRRYKGKFKPVAMDFELSSRLGRFRAHSVPVMTIRNRGGESKVRPLSKLESIFVVLLAPVSLSAFKLNRLRIAGSKSQEIGLPRKH
ncbi:MAG: hypothetical protein RL460_643 [Actinomycetota bacterium]|jgi:hypothetical protein